MGNEADVRDSKKLLDGMPTLNSRKKQLVNKYGLSAFRSNATLRDDDWKAIDEAVLEVAKETLVGVQDLRDNGLSRDIPLGVMFSNYETSTGTGSANVSLDGSASTPDSGMEFNEVKIPVPFVSKEFMWSDRQLESSNRSGDALDDLSVADATHRVAKKLEDILFNGTNRQLGGSTVPGYTTQSDRNQSTTAGSWGTISNIFDTVNNMIGDLEDAEHMANLHLYLAGDLIEHTRQKTSNDNRVIDLLRSEWEEIEAVRRAPSLASGEAVMVSLTRRTVDLVEAEPIQAIEEEGMFGRTHNFQVAGVMAPRVKSDNPGNSGVSHITGAG